MSFAMRSLMPPAILAGALLAQACIAKSDEGADAGASNGSGGMNVAGSLNDRTFLFESADGFVPVEGTTVRVSFRAGEVSFNAGCNSHSGSYSVANGKLVVQSLGSTLLGCDAARHEQDEWLADFITSSPALDLDGDVLTLEGAFATLRFLDREVADPDRTLTSGTWIIDTLIQGGVAQGGFAVEPTVRFNAGSVQVFTGCNAGAGEYSVSGDEITVSGMTYTEEVCEAVDVIPIEEHIEQVIIDGILIHQIEAARLTIMRGDLGVMATTE